MGFCVIIIASLDRDYEPYNLFLKWFNILYGSSFVELSITGVMTDSEVCIVLLYGRRGGIVFMMIIRVKVGNPSS